MKIALCDDNTAELLNIVSLIRKYASEKNETLSLATFQSGAELVEALAAEAFDLIFLDILMPGITGMEAAREIRNSDSAVKIIFLTTSAEFAVESYPVGAYHYLLKPASKEKIFPVLDKLFRDPDQAGVHLTVKNGSNIFVLPFRHIEYVEINAKKLYFFMTDGSVKEAADKLSDYESTLLARPEFVKTHRSFLVNMSRISELAKDEAVTETGKRVPVSRAFSGAVRSAYTELLFHEARELRA